MFSAINFFNINAFVKESFTIKQLESFHGLYVDFKMERTAQKFDSINMQNKSVLFRDVLKEINQTKQNYHTSNKLIEKILLENDVTKEKKSRKIL